jgi:hypothetical protein
LTANLKGTSENIIKAALSDVNIQSKRLILGSGNGEVSIVVDRTLTGFTLSDLP